MVVWTGEQRYSGSSATDIVRKMEREAVGYPSENGTLYDFLIWSFAQLSDRIPPRELALSRQLDDETLALSYLCLLEQYGLGELCIRGHSGKSGNWRVSGRD